MTIGRWLMLMTTLSVVAACAAPRVNAPAAPEVPAEFSGTSGAESHWPTQDWYRAFGSDELNSLIDAAATANFDVQAARARVLQADARARQAGAGILPTVIAEGGINFLTGHSSNGGGHETDWSALLSASYEVDFWGRKQAAVESATMQVAAARAERDAVALTTLAGVADSYFQLLALRERVAVAESNVETSQQLLRAIEARANVAMAGPIDVAGQKAVVSAAQIQTTELRRSEAEATTALSFLLGRAPEGFSVSGQPLDALQEPAIEAGLPSELLTRRPDVFLAEANLRAGQADLAAARAAMLPTLSLTASGGVQNPALSAAVLTIPGAGPSLAIGANLLQPIFDHGRLRTQREEVEARQRELLVQYRAAIIAAFNDVENALTALHYLDQAREFHQANVEQSELMLAGMRERYQVGTTDMQGLLDAQRSLYAARDQLIQNKVARLQAIVGLAKALGGGWNHSQASGSEP